MKKVPVKRTTAVGVAFGTNSVTGCVVGRRGVIQRTSTVALEPGVVADGVVRDSEALALALRQLKRTLKIGGARVNFVIGGPQLVVRPINLPTMPLNELRAAARIQASDHLPAAVFDPVIDVQRMSPSGSDDHELPNLLLTAIPSEVVRAVVSACEHGRIRVGRIDAMPLALARALGTTDGAVEAVVSIRDGATEIGVVGNGDTFFARTLPSGVSSADVAASDPAAAADLMFPLLEEIRTTLAYATTQVRRAKLERIVLAAPADLFRLLSGCLSATLQIEVVDATERLYLPSGKLGTSIDIAAIAAATGAAIGASVKDGWAVSLVPGEVEEHRVRTRQIAIAGGAVASVALVLGGASYARAQSISDAQQRLTAARLRGKSVTAQLAKLNPVSQQLKAASDASSQAAGVLHGDIDWPKLLSDVSRAMPANVQMISFSGMRTPEGGSFTVTLNSTDANGASAWLRSMSAMPQVSTLWVPSVSYVNAPVSGGSPAPAPVSGPNSATGVKGALPPGSSSFSSTVVIGDAAVSARAQRFGGQQ